MNTAKNQGRNVKRIREIVGVKQEALASGLGVSQQRMSDIEQKEVLDEELMKQIAEILKVPVESIKNFDEEKAINIIASNNNGKDYSSAVNFQCTFNPIEKWVEALEENKKLYERLLQAEKEKNQLLEKLLSEKK